MFKSLYPRQQVAVARLWAKVEANVTAVLIRLLLVFATGSGKTKIAGVFASKWMRFRREQSKTHRVLFLCHHDEILERSLESFAEVFGVALYAIPGFQPKLAMYRRNRRDWMDADVVFASFQALYPRLQTGTMPFGKQDFSLVIVDESHRGDAPTFKKVVHYFNPNIRFGITATPRQEEERDTAEMFGEPVDTLTLEEGIGGPLADLEYELVVDDLAKKQLRRQLTKLDTSGGELQLADLNRAFVIPERDERIIQTLRRRLARVENAKVIIFCPSTQYCDWLATKLSDSVVIHSNGIRKKVRKRRLADFRRGETESGDPVRIALTVDWLNEGIDVPEANVGVFLRTTESERIWKQQLGRLLRRTEGKLKALILDFAGNCERLQRVTALEAEVKRLRRHNQTLTEVEAPAFKFIFDSSAVDILTAMQRIEAQFSDETLLADLRQLSIQLGGRSPLSTECRRYSLYIRRWISWDGALIAAGLEPLESRIIRTPAELLVDLKTVATKLKRSPTPSEYDDAREDRMAVSLTIERAFDNDWNGALAALELPPVVLKRKRTDKQLIEDFKRLATELMRTPLPADVDAASRGGTCANWRVYKKRFKTYKVILRRTQLRAQTKQTFTKTRRSDERLIADLAKLIKRVGKRPTAREIDAASRTGNCASSMTYRTRFGGLGPAYDRAEQYNRGS